MECFFIHIYKCYGFIFGVLIVYITIGHECWAGADMYDKPHWSDRLREIFPLRMSCSVSVHPGEAAVFPWVRHVFARYDILQFCQSPLPYHPIFLFINVTSSCRYPPRLHTSGFKTRLGMIGDVCRCVRVIDPEKLIICASQSKVTPSSCIGLTSAFHAS